MSCSLKDLLKNKDCYGIEEDSHQEIREVVNDHDHHFSEALGSTVSDIVNDSGEDLYRGADDGNGQKAYLDGIGFKKGFLKGEKV